MLVIAEFGGERRVFIGETIVAEGCGETDMKGVVNKKGGEGRETRLEPGRVIIKEKETGGVEKIQNLELVSRASDDGKSRGAVRLEAVQGRKEGEVHIGYVS